jgi:hypothetical protein
MWNAGAKRQGDKDDGEGDEDARRPFILEAQATSARDHPNICAIGSLAMEAGSRFAPTRPGLSCLSAAREDEGRRYLHPAASAAAKARSMRSETPSSEAQRVR